MSEWKYSNVGAVPFAVEFTVMMVLDVAVGTGVLTMPVYETLGVADITCLDYSTDMMERAKRQARKRGA